MPTVMVTAQTYVVQSGDYLANIAERHCVTMEEIAGYNNWSDGASHPLFPDQVIQIPPGACGGQAVNDGVAMVPTLFPTVPDSENSEVLPPSGGFAQVSYDNAPVMRGLIGRRDGDAIVEAFTLTAGPWLNPVPGDEPTPTTVFGQAATVATEPGTPPLTTVTWGDAPMLSITGLDPEAFLEDADPAFATASSPGGVTELTIGELTAGWEVLAPPEPARLGSVSASLSVNDTSDVEGNLVEVSVDNPLIALATVAPLRPVDINGVDGWLSEAPGNWVTWQVDQSTYALVGGSVTAEESLELARSIEWVDVGTWMTTYGLQLPVFGPG